MPEPSSPAPIAPEPFRRAWRMVCVSSMFGVFYFTIEYTGAARVRFLTELKATPFDIGLIAALYALAFGFQVVCAFAIARMTRRKVPFLALAAAHRVLFLLVPLAPYFIADERARIWFIIAALFAHDSIQQLATPIYFSWMADLVPSGAFNRHWGARQRYITCSTFVSSFILALGFQVFERAGQVVFGFLVFSVLATLGGLLDLALFSGVPETPKHREQPAPLARTLAEPLRNAAFRRFLGFMVFTFFITMMAQPFFAYYMIRGLGMTVLTVQMVMLVEAIGGMLSSRFWGLVCDVYGQENGLQLTILLKVAVPLTLILVPAAPAVAVPALVAAFFLDGLMNAGYLIAWQGMMLKSTPRTNRGMYIGATNFLCQGLAGGLAPLVCGALIEPLGRVFNGHTGYIHWNGYLVIFAAAAAARLAAWPVGWRLQATAPVPFRKMMGELLQSNPLAVTRALYQLHGASHPARRVHAATVLGRLRSPLATSGLVDALRDPVAGVREAATEALGRIGAAEAREPLARVLGEPDLGLQPLAARALGHIGGAESLRALLGSLERLDPEALDQTVAALVEIDHEAALLPLICLHEKVKNPVLRRRITEALGRLAHASSPNEIALALASEEERT